MKIFKKECQHSEPGRKALLQTNYRNFTSVPTKQHPLPLTSISSELCCVFFKQIRIESPQPTGISYSFVCRSVRRKNNLNLVLRCRAASTFNYATFTLKFYCPHYWTDRPAGTRIRDRIRTWTQSFDPSSTAVHSAVVSVTHFAPLSKVGGERWNGRAVVRPFILARPSPTCMSYLSWQAGHFDSPLKGERIICAASELAMLLAYFLMLPTGQGANWYRQELKDGMTLSALRKNKKKK